MCFCCSSTYTNYLFLSSIEFFFWMFYYSLVACGMSFGSFLVMGFLSTIRISCVLSYVPICVYDFIIFNLPCMFVYGFFILELCTYTLYSFFFSSLCLFAFLQTFFITCVCSRFYFIMGFSSIISTYLFMLRMGICTLYIAKLSAF